MKQRKFKIGQKLQFKPRGLSYAALPGATAVVTSLLQMPTYITVKWIKNSLAKYQHDGDYFPYDFNVQFKPLKSYLNKALKNKRITNLQYLEMLHENNP